MSPLSHEMPLASMPVLSVFHCPFRRAGMAEFFTAGIPLRRPEDENRRNRNPAENTLLKAPGRAVAFSAMFFVKKALQIRL